MSRTDAFNPLTAETAGQFPLGRPARHLAPNNHLHSLDGVCAGFAPE